MGSWCRTDGFWSSLISLGHDVLHIANCISLTIYTIHKDYFKTPTFPLSNALIVTVVIIKITDIILTVINPFRYCGASTCCQTTCGNQAWKTYAISFMLPITRARSSLSSEQISWAHLFCCQFFFFFLFFFFFFLLLHFVPLPVDRGLTP